MNQLTSLFVLALAVFPACRGQGQTYRAAVGPMFARTTGDIALQNAAGTLELGQEQNDVDSDLGLGDTEAVPYVRLQTDVSRHRVRLHGFGVDAEGNGTLAGDYGGIPAGAPVRTSMQFFAINANYGYELLRDRHYRLAVGGQAAFYSLDVAARSSPGREEVETSVLVPMPFVEGELFFEQFTLGANFGVMGADLGDASGRYLDTEAYVQWQVNKDFDLLVGYRYLVLDGYGRASDRDFDADLDLQGVFFTAGVRF